MRNVSWVLVLLVMFYIGEDGGRFISGIKGDIRGDGLWLGAEIRTYVDRFNLMSYHPHKALFKMSVGCGSIEMSHYCIHPIDSAGKIEEGNRLSIHLDF